MEENKKIVIKAVETPQYYFITGGCEYCETGKFIINQGLIERVLACVIGNTLVVEWTKIIDEYMHGYSSCAKQINYCPMCGAKLRTE